MAAALDISEHKFASHDDGFETGSYRVYHREFASLLHTEVLDLCAMCNQLLLTHQQQPENISLNSGGVYRFIMECTRCEDLLDQVHADQQVDWVYIRKLAAIIKHSCSITSNLQYLAVLAEKLKGAVEGNFAMANQFVLRDFYNVLLESAQNFLKEMRRLNVIEPDHRLPMVFLKYFTSDISPLIRLKTTNPFRNDRVNSEKNIVLKKKQEVVLYLVSTLLQNCDVIDYFSHLLSAKMNMRGELIKNELHEESLTVQRELFHSIITFFDTHYSQKQIIDDSDLLHLLNHVKVIHQLFTGLATLIRIEERHFEYFVQQDIDFHLSKESIEGIIFDFFVSYIDRFRWQIEKLAKTLIRKYSVWQEICVSVPCYRGFHVRPSTLVARIVMHYGSKVTMKLKDTTYNAAVPLDLFRANEVINAEKRREIGDIIVADQKCQEYLKLLRKNQAQDQILMQKYFLELFQNLQRQEKIVVYELLLMESLEAPSSGEDFLEYIKREVAYLMATGKIDIISNLEVFFEGDSRVLKDIAILAENGYGEDKAGNNISLPKELSYLRK